jgi:thiol-disulfide isomerase/thioredoxin
MAGAAALAGCTTSSRATAPPNLPSNPPHARLVAAAHLDPCPMSRTTRVSALPEVTLPCLGAGPRVHLAGLTGMPTVVNIWGSWCGPCQVEAPHVSAVYDALKGRVRFLGVDDEDDPDSALDFATHVRPPIRYPSVVDEDKKVLLALHETAVPMTLFVTSSGRIAHTTLGPYRSAAALRADIGRYLGVAA